MLPSHLSRQHRGLLLDVLLALAVVGVSLLVRGWGAEIAGDNAYYEFLRTQWMLVAGGKGVALDPLSLPLPPLVYLAATTLGGPAIAEAWLPIAMSVAILLVLTRVLLAGYPVAAKLLAAVPLLASPFFYLLQWRLDLQLFVLVLGLQVATLRAFRMQPTVARVTLAVGLNIVLSLTSYTAPVALGAAVGYLLLVANHRREVNAAAWRALLWLYGPFSLTGYLIWAVAWSAAGSRLKTSYFLTAGPQAASALAGFMSNLSQVLGLPILLLAGLALVLVIFVRSPQTRMRGGRSQAVGWVVLTFAATALLWIGVRTLVENVPSDPDAITFALVLLVPAAIGSVYGQTRNILHGQRSSASVMLVVGLGTVTTVFLVQYALRPIVWRDGLVSAEQRAAAARDAATAFQVTDPGGRVLVDPRFAATFALAAGIDPTRLLTPFDPDFAAVVADPPADVQIVVVTDAPDDFVGGNYPAMRLVQVLPDAMLLADGTGSSHFVRVFQRMPVVQPAENAEQQLATPYAEAEERLLAEVRHRLDSTMLPTRLDGWAYGIDVVNMLLYAAERGDGELFRAVDDVVRQRFLITELADRNALYTIAWRAKVGAAADASGTTESLRIAEGYLVAAERWGNADFSRLAHVIASSYVRHEQAPDQASPRWFIRNYYNFATKQYATNTFTVDYDPDVLRRVALQTGDLDIRQAWIASIDLLRAAQHPSGLFFEMYQPEVRTIHPEMEFFSPNGVFKTYDSIEVARGLADSDRTVAALTLEFARERDVSLTSEYTLPAMKEQPGVERNLALPAGVTRLAVKLGDATLARRQMDEEILPRLDGFLQAPTGDAWYFDASIVLLALRELQQHLPATAS